MGINNKDCSGNKPSINNRGNTSFVILILFILMAIIVGGKYFY